MSEEETTTVVENADEATEVATPETATAENTSTEDTAAEAADEQDEAAKAEEKPKVDLKQRKIAKQAREIREMKREQARMSKMLETQIETASRASKEGEAPKIENYETMDEYLDARDSYRDGKMETIQETPDQNPHEDMFANGSERYEDFEEVVNSSNSITQAMATAVFGVDDPDLQVDIAYFLGNNAKDAARISRLPPARQMAEITKLEIQLSSKPAKQTASKAPKPIKPVGGKNTSSDDIQGTEKFESFMKKRNKQLGRTN